MARSAGDIQTELDAVRAAMSAMIGGTRVERYAKGATSIDFGKVSYADLQARESDLLVELDVVNAGAAGPHARPVFHDSEWPA